MTSLTFPLVLADFLERLPISEISLDNPEQVEMSGTGGGEIIAVDVGPQLWTGEIKLGRMTLAEAVQAEALIDMVRGVNRSFMVCDMRRPGPAYDPAGAFIATYSPVISDLNADNLRLKISGLPPSYMLTRGDKLGFTYGTDPTRYALHRIASISVTADGAGQTDWIELTTHIRSGAAVSAAVSLVKPQCKAKLVPRSSNMGASRRTISQGASFKFIQTLR